MPLSPGSAVASAGTALPEGAGTEGPGSAAAGVLGELAISTASGVAPRLLLRQGGNELVSAGGTSLPALLDAFATASAPGAPAAGVVPVERSGGTAAGQWPGIPAPPVIAWPHPGAPNRCEG